MKVYKQWGKYFSGIFILGTEEHPRLIFILIDQKCNHKAALRGT